MALTIVGLGDARSAAPHVINALKSCSIVYLQTDRYAAFNQIREEGKGEYLDPLYESCENFEAFNRAVCERVLKFAKEGDAALCVAGDGVYDNAAACAVVKAAKEGGIKVRILPGASLATAALGKAGILPENGYRITTDLNKEKLTVGSGECLIVPEINNLMRASEAKLKLMEGYGAEHGVYLVDPLSEEDAAFMPLFELDRHSAFTPFTTLIVPGVSLCEKERFSVEDLIEVCRMLRSPDGCPWDREQTHESLRRNLLEEAYEVLGAMGEEDPMHMAEEFGDLLLQIALHSVIGEEFGEYDITDVATSICQKMIRRHPHVFGTVEVSSTGEVLDNWEEIKRQERGQKAKKSYLADVGKGLPPLKMAEELQKKAARWGFDWDDYLPAAEKVKEELCELLTAKESGTEEEALIEAGDLLFACVNTIRLMELDGDTGLYLTCEKFKQRFLAMEQMAEEQGRSLQEMTLDEMDTLWERAKKVKNS